MNIYTLFGTDRKYDRETVGGIEIESCFKPGQIAAIFHENAMEVNRVEDEAIRAAEEAYEKSKTMENFRRFNAVLRHSIAAQKEVRTAYIMTDDGSIRCSDGLVSIEYITEKPYPIVDIMDDNTKIGKDTNVILNNAYPCASNKGVVTCGTHVHMSRKGITKEKYPNFNVVVRYMWLTYYQPYCLARFYRYQNRYKNEYAVPSSEEDIYEKYQMFNEKHSIGLKPNEDWHFEFRGYGEMRSGWKEDKGAPKEYMRVLMNMWVYAIDYYETFNLREWDRIEIEKRDEPADKEKDEELQNILYEFIRTPGTGEAYEDKVNTFKRLFRTHLWYVLKRRTPLKF
jgi:hypothetical protein